MNCMHRLFFLSNDIAGESADLWVEGQCLRVIGVNNWWVRLKDDALTRRLESSSTHSHKQVHHLRRSGLCVLFQSFIIFTICMYAFCNACMLHFLTRCTHFILSSLEKWWPEENTKLVNNILYDLLGRYLSTSGHFLCSSGHHTKCVEGEHAQLPGAHSRLYERSYM